MAREAVRRAVKKASKAVKKRLPPSVCVLGSLEVQGDLLQAVLDALEDFATDVDPALRFTADILVCLDAGGETPWKLSTLRERPAKSVVYAVIGREASAIQALSLGSALLDGAAFPDALVPGDIAAWVKKEASKWG